MSLLAYELCLLDDLGFEYYFNEVQRIVCPLLMLFEVRRVISDNKPYALTTGLITLNARLQPTVFFKSIQGAVGLPDFE